jgi:hypothetical protein
MDKKSLNVFYFIKIRKMKKLILGGISYISLRNMYYYPYLENRLGDKRILYSSYLGNTLLMCITLPFSLPMSIVSDIGFIERKMRNIPMTEYDRPFMLEYYQLRG